MRHGSVTRCQCLAASLAALVPLAPLRAQSVSTPEPGVRVRVFASSIDRGGLVGNLVSFAHDTLAINPENRADTVVVLLSELTRLEQSTGPRTRSLRFGGIGLLVGAVGGAILGRASGDDPPTIWGNTASEKARMDAIGLGVVGWIVGAVIGSNCPTEGWTPLRLPSGARISVAPLGGMRLALAYSLALQ